MSPQAALSVDAVGPAATIQDGGRFGLLRFGVTPAGPMDPAALALSNLALGNPAGAAGLEIGPGGIALRCEATLTVAFAGGGFRWSRDDQALPAAGRVALRLGETLRARAGVWGMWGYLAVPGGIDVPVVMGSRATHVRSRLGGFRGRPLAVGDRLIATGSVAAGDDVQIRAEELEGRAGPIRVILGPQDDQFTAEARDTLLNEGWRLTTAADRMAYRFEGRPLRHAGDFNIVSDGVALGAVQVAGDGQPIVLMADRQPTGGYPKIAHVARADLGRLAQLRPGASCRFQAISIDEAVHAWRDLDHQVAASARLLMPWRATPAAERLTGNNLIGGVTDGAD